MTTLDPFMVHVAAAPAGLLQRCVACGFVLQDNTAWAEGRVAVPDGDDRGPTWWPVGERVATDKSDAVQASCTYLIDGGRELDVDERLCAGAN